MARPPWRFASVLAVPSIQRRQRSSVALVAAILVSLCVAACEQPEGTPNASAGSSVASTAAATLSGGASAGAPSASGPSATGSSGTSGGSTATGGSGSTAGAEALQGAFESVVSTVGPSVVLIQTSEGLGSGVVFDTQGDIVTNAHVVGSDTTFEVTTSAGQRLQARLVGSFAADDIAVIRASGGSLAPASFGDSSKLAVGEIVLALGNPLGLQSSVTAGIVSALGRTVSEPGGAALAGTIQTSAAINPGNSGGALADLDNQVIGIPTLAATDPELGGSAPGIGFAIPSNIASDIATQLIQHGKVVSSHRAYLGVEAANIQGGAGVLVYSVDAGGPAEQAGIPAGVLITTIDGTAIPDTSTLAAVLATLSPGQAVDVQIEHEDGSTATIKVTLGELPG